MSFGFSFFNNPALFSTTAEAVPELGIEPDDIEIPPVEVPEPEIKPDPVVSNDTFQLSSQTSTPVTDSTTSPEQQPQTPTTIESEKSSSDIFQSSSNPQITSNVFTQQSTIDWTKVTYGKCLIYQ